MGPRAGAVVSVLVSLPAGERAAEERGRGHLCDPRSARTEYLARINRVLDHIERNLDRPISLAELAGIAHFSRFHFHRIFAAVVGETPGQFVLRLRLERAARALLVEPRISVTEVAMAGGFSSPATFARAFKEAFSMSSTEWRASYAERMRSACSERPEEPESRKIRKALRKQGNAKRSWTCYSDTETNKLIWRCDMSTDKEVLRPDIEVREEAAHHVVYLRYIGPYGQTDLMPRLIAKLQSFAAPRGLITPESRLFVVAHDSPTITEAAKLRLSVCLTAPTGIQGGGEFGTMTISGGRYAVGRFEISPARVAQAWGLMVGDWLPQSGYEPDARLCYEEIIVSPREHAEGKIVLDIFLPVRAL